MQVVRLAPRAARPGPLVVGAALGGMHEAAAGTGGVFYATKGATTATPIDTNTQPSTLDTTSQPAGTETRAVEIANNGAGPELYVPRDFAPPGTPNDSTDIRTLTNASGGLPKCVLTGGVWTLDYDLVNGLNLVNNATSFDNTRSGSPTDPGVTGLFGLTGEVVGNQIELFAPVPEPASLTVLAAGVAGLGFLRRRTRPT